MMHRTPMIVSSLLLTMVLVRGAVAHDGFSGPIPEDILANRQDLNYLRQSANFSTPAGSHGLHYYYYQNETAQELILNLLNSDVARNQAAALQVIGHCGGSEREDLRDAVFVRLIDLSSSSSRHVRRRTVDALARVRTRKAIPTLIGLLTDSDWYVRGAAVDVLHNLKARSAIRHVEALDQTEGNQRNRKFIKRFLKSAVKWKGEEP